MTEYCDECGAPMIKLGVIKNTRKWTCPDCLVEKVEWVKYKNCEHEYDDKNGNKCIHCGEPSIHYNA